MSTRVRRSVKVVGVPMGPAPYEVRKEWVGLVLTAERYPGPDEEVGLCCFFPAKAMEIDPISGRTMPSRGGVSVSVKEALEVLEKKSPEAADWFKKNWPSLSGYFTFGPNEVEWMYEPA